MAHSDGSVVIAIDGPAAAGKSTVARRLANLLRFIYVDSGSLYRAVTWQALRSGIDVADPSAVAHFVESLDLRVEVNEGRMTVNVGGIDPGLELRSLAVNEHVSPVSAIPEVRARVREWLRSLVRSGHLVVEGRDIGTAVFPDTPYKFYLDADPLERARRRQRDLHEGGDPIRLEEVNEALARRDRLDRDRKTDPLRIAPGAVIIDTTLLSVDDVVRAILSRLPADLGLKGGNEPVKDVGDKERDASSS